VGKAGSLIRKHDPYTPARKMRRDVRALTARNQGLHWVYTRFTRGLHGFTRNYLRLFVKLGDEVVDEVGAEVVWRPRRNIREVHQRDVPAVDPGVFNAWYGRVCCGSCRVRKSVLRKLLRKV